MGADEVAVGVERVEVAADRCRRRRRSGSASVGDRDLARPRRRTRRARPCGRPAAGAASRLRLGASMVSAHVRYVQNTEVPDPATCSHSDRGESCGSAAKSHMSAISCRLLARPRIRRYYSHNNKRKNAHTTADNRRTAEERHEQRARIKRASSSRRRRGVRPRTLVTGCTPGPAATTPRQAATSPSSSRSGGSPSCPTAPSAG